MATANPSRREWVLNRGTYGGALLASLFVVAISATGIQLGSYWQNPPSLLALAALIGAIVGGILGNASAWIVWALHLRSPNTLPQLIWAIGVFAVILTALLLSFSFVEHQNYPGVLVSIMFATVAGLCSLASGIRLNKAATKESV